MNAPDAPLASPDDFLGLEQGVHMAAAGESPPLASHERVVHDFLMDKAGGMSGRERIFDRVDEARRTVASHLTCSADDVGFPLNVAHGVNLVARGVGGPGDNAVMVQWEYPSASYPWMVGSEMDVRLVRGPRPSLDLDRIAEAVDSRTRAIVTSLVSYYTGELVDLGALRRMADAVGAVVIVDISHALGVMQLDLSDADFAFSCGYKWSLGVHGAGVGYCNRTRQPEWRPREVGWTSAEWIDAPDRDLRVVPVSDGRRFELGNPAVLPVLLLANGLAYLNGLGMEEVEAHVRNLATRLLDGLTSDGVTTLTPSATERRLGIVSFAVEDEQRWRLGLEARGVRAWIGDRRVRLSPHVYNGETDVARVLAAVRAVRTAGAD
jgi:cysteine desulfurase / selenocysteine lyase